MSSSEEVKPVAPKGIEAPERVEVAEQQPGLDKVSSVAVVSRSELADPTPSKVAESAPPQKPPGFFQERPPHVIEVAPQLLRDRTRRDVLLFGMGAIAAVAGGGSLLPQPTLERLGIIHGNKNWPKKEWLLNKSLRIDDEFSEALYSRNRWVPT